MTTRTLSVTIPEELYERIEKARKEGHYNRSELVREALRRFFGIPAVNATPDEIAAMKEGREAYERGEYVTLDDMLSE